MTLQKACVVVSLFIGLTTSASAWGWQGHEVIGSIADRLLGDNASRHVKQLLQFDLRTAGPWADCVKSVKPQRDGSFEYIPEAAYSVACGVFATPTEIPRMEDYVARNWSSCPSSRPNEKSSYCHGSYHFTDVAIQHDHYDRKYKGTRSVDIVGAINAAILVLQGRPAPKPFSIKDGREALLLLAHLVGDLHQPLHVAAFYLARDGERVDPDEGTFDPETETRGGNYILDSSKNLHSEWDSIPRSLGSIASDAMVEAAKAVPAMPASVPIDQYAAVWASDTILAAKEAFDGLTFTGHGDRKWDVVFQDRKAYLRIAAQLKRTQLVKGGARLSELLNAIWP